MTIVDLNILLYAMNSEAAEHDRARTRREDALNDEEVIGLPWVVLLGFLPLSTNPRAFPHALSTSAATAKTDIWLARDNVRVVSENVRHRETLKPLLGGSGAAGNLSTDAHLAALAISHDAVLVSSDSDFARFTDLRWENPLRS